MTAPRMAVTGVCARAFGGRGPNVAVPGQRLVPGVTDRYVAHAVWPS